MGYLAIDSQSVSQSVLCLVLVHSIFLSFQIEDFETSITWFLLLLLSSYFFPKLKLLNISAIQKAIILIFFQFSFYSIYLQVFKITNFNPTNRRTSITSIWSSTQKNCATQNFIEDKLTGRVDLLFLILCLSLFCISIICLFIFFLRFP